MVMSLLDYEFFWFMMLKSTVIPAQAGIFSIMSKIPTFAGMTVKGSFSDIH
jgi:hypothetical protein